MASCTSPTTCHISNPPHCRGPFLLSPAYHSQLLCAAATADFAENAGKNDQYVTLDPSFDASNDLHKRLYAHTRHAGKVGYILVCRVLLGHPARTQQMGKNAKSMDDDSPIFPLSFRELAPVSGVTPPTFHHSLVAEKGVNIARFREFIIFHGEYIYPEYILAYQRFKDTQGPLG